MWCDSPSCSVDSRPGPTDCSERFCVAAWAISKLCEGQVLIPGRSEAHKHDITGNRMNIKHGDFSQSQSFLSAPSCCIRCSLHTAAHILPSIEIESRNCSSPVRCLNDGSKPQLMPYERRGREDRLYICAVIVFQPAHNVMGKTHPRVVSLLPSATDILAVAGAVDLLVGRSHE